MAAQIWEGYPSRDFTTGGENPSRGLNWIVDGTADELEVDNLVRANSPVLYYGLIFQNVKAKQIAPMTWEAQTLYGARKPPKQWEYKFTFDTTGGKQKITQSLDTVGKYAPPGQTAPDHGGAIGVTDHRVEGCEIVVPKFAWSETWQLPFPQYGWAYAQVVDRLTGKVNASRFRGFPAGTVLFHGGKGSQSSKDPNLIEITFLFERSDNVKAKQIGTITGINKGGWEYLWVHYAQKHDTTANAIATQPDAVYVEKVYDADNLALLQIGS